MNTPDKKLETNFEVLLVEDEEINAMVVEQILQDKFIVDRASNAKQAIDKACKKKYFFILMDINLRHGMTGLEAAREIRKINGYESVPIVAVTAYAMQKDKDSFIAGGCTHYLEKPFSTRELLALIESIENKM